jgi:hypothetical protein
VEKLVRRAMHLANEREFDALAQLPFHPEFESHSFLFAVSDGTVHGTAGLREWAADVDAIWETFEVELEEVRKADPDRPCAPPPHRQREGQRDPLDERAGQIWTRRDGLIWRNVGYPSHAETLRTAGL